MSDVTIESLELEIQANATQASNGIEALAKQLELLKSSTSGGIRSLNTISTQLERLSKTVMLFGGYSGRLDEISDSLRRLASTAFNLNAVDLGNNLKDIKKALGKFDASKLDSVSNAVTKLKNTSSGINSAASAMKALGDATEKTGKAAKTTTLRFTEFNNAMQFLKNAASVMRSIFAKPIDASNKYIENMNLFNVTMGEYATEAQAYAEKVGEIMGIDPGDWMRNQGVFNTIIKGFGVAGDKAALMSKNLTQLGYDLSSFYNITVEDAMQKIQSGIAGELEPLRRLGYDLSITRLQQEALNLGITKSVNAMTQAEKSQLRYHAILTQVTDAQTDMARTLDAPANQIRILTAQIQMCVRAIGNLFIPILNKVIPYIIAFVKVVRSAIEALARLFGFSYDSASDVFENIGASVGAVGDLEDGADGAGGALGKAADKAKKLKNNLLGIDELNIISPQDDALGGAGGGAGAGDVGFGGDLGIELPEYDFLNGLEERIDGATEKLKELLPIVETIGIALASWKLAGLVKDLSEVGIAGSKLGGFFDSLLVAGGAFLTIDGAIDAIKNGVNWKNALEIMGGISSLSYGIFRMVKKHNPDMANLAGGLTAAAGGIGAVAIALVDMNTRGVGWENVALWIGGTLTAVKGLNTAFKNMPGMLGKIGKTAGPLMGAVSSILGLSTGIKDIIKNGPNASNVFSVVVGIIGSITFAVQALTEACKINPIFAILMGVGMAVSAIVSIFDAICGSVDEMSEEVREAGRAAYEATPEFDKLNYKIEALQELSDNAKTAMSQMGDSVKGLSDINDSFTVARDILTEIYKINDNPFSTALDLEYMVTLIQELDALGLGDLTEQFNIVAGRITFAKDEAFKMLEALQQSALIQGITQYIADLQIQYIQLERDIETATQEGKNAGEAWAKAYRDVIEYMKNAKANGEKLWESEEFASLWAAAEHAAQYAKETENTLDGLTNAYDKAGGDIKYFQQQLKDFSAGKIKMPGIDPSEYENTAKALDGTITSYQQKLQKSMMISNSDGRNIVKGSLVGMKEELSGPEILGVYGRYGTIFQDVMKIESPSKVFKEYGIFMVQGLVKGLSDPKENNGIENWAQATLKSFNDSMTAGSWTEKGKEVVTLFSRGISANYGLSRTAIATWASSIKQWFTNPSNGGVNREQWSMYGAQLAQGFTQGITNSYSSTKTALNTWGNNVKTWFNKPDGVNTLNTMFQNIGKDVIDGFNKGINDFYETTLPYMQKWAKAAKLKFKAELDSSSPSKVYMHIGEDTVEGYNIGIEKSIPSTVKTMSAWSKSFVGISPSISVDTSSAEYAQRYAMAQTMSGEVTGSYIHSVSTEGISDSMEDFYHNYLEPTLKDIAADTKRQADKDEQTNVYVGNRVVTDAVSTQRKANGYSFVGG